MQTAKQVDLLCLLIYGPHWPNALYKLFNDIFELGFMIVEFSGFAVNFNTKIIKIKWNGMESRKSKVKNSARS